MKITKIEPIVLRAPYGEMDLYWGSGFWGTKAQGKSKKVIISPQEVEDRALWRLRATYSPYIETTLVKVTTDDGIVGYGEAHGPIAPQVCASVMTNLLAPLVIGEDP